MKALLLACAAGLLCSPSWAAKRALANDIQVLSVEGAKLLVGGRSVGAGYFPAPGVRLTIGGGGLAVLRIGTAGHIQLQGPANFEVVAGERPGLSLLRGKLLAALPSLKGVFEVRARSIVAAVRGTDFFMDVQGGKDTYICVCHGTVEVYEEGSGGFHSVITADHHEGHLYKAMTNTMLQSDHEMSGHSDEGLDALKALSR